MYRPPLNTCPPNPDSRRPPRPGGGRTSAGSCCRHCSRWVGIFAVRLLAPKTRRGGAAKSHPSLCGSWLLASRVYSSRGGLLTAMIRCRYQELDLAECHAVATAVCHCAGTLPADWAPTLRNRWFADSAQEGEGFGPSVPRQRTLFETGPLSSSDNARETAASNFDSSTARYS